MNFTPLLAPLVVLAAFVTERLPVESEEVLTFLHHANQTEIIMGKLAQLRGHSAAIRNFGIRLIRDRLAADEKVANVARLEQINVPSKPMSRDEENVLIYLRNLSGTKFDQAFADQMESDHETAISTLEGDLLSLSTASRTTDLVTTLLPTLRQDLGDARTIAAELDTPSAQAREPAAPDIPRHPLTA